ncbi:hypothetical protein LX32DRAFT_285912 [Colletotrichum zoysiae]|uniref:Uncharacterized protein n=1 Tax=Colletotrichum zoysiae TaxID=1216348 RepID=A0AAD9H333_9PEZI|nr:hypothetical protein LX32DRAFT_285912 [Colletotrichum zoysiae]
MGLVAPKRKKKKPQHTHTHTHTHQVPDVRSAISADRPRSTSVPSLAYLIWERYLDTKSPKTRSAGPVPPDILPPRPSSQAMLALRPFGCGSRIADESQREIVAALVGLWRCVLANSLPPSDGQSGLTRQKALPGSGKKAFVVLRLVPPARPPPVGQLTIVTGDSPRVHECDAVERPTFCARVADSGGLTNEATTTTLNTTGGDDDGSCVFSNTVK